MTKVPFPHPHLRWHKDCAWLPTALETWLASPGHPNILVGNSQSQEVWPRLLTHPPKTLLRKTNHYKVNPAMQGEINLIQTILSVFTSGIYTGAAGLTLSRII